MERHLLLTMGGDGGRAWNLNFAGGFFRNKTEMRLTLFYVVQEAYCDRPGGCELSENDMRTARVQLDKAREHAIKLGFVPDNVECKAVPRQFGVVRDIVAEGHKGLYDAVVSGRRYRGFLEQLYGSSVSRGLLWEDIAFPLWICHEPDPGLSNVLLCVDGSDENLRMADHVGFMLAEETHSVTLCHFRDPAIDGFLAIEGARAALVANGVDASRVEVLSLEAHDRAASILRIADEGGYAVVAVGRRHGLPDNLMRRMFGGTVSERLHTKVDRFSLWVSK